uniref:VLRF1 domain-containing protein n=1 Tax=Arundo donax TaxID=35708 RepID=A0A0A9ET46_ARUDO
MAAVSPEKRPPRSLFDLPADFFDSSVLLRAHPSSAPSAAEPSEPSRAPPPPTQQQQQPSEAAGFRWTCNTCAAEFESLQEQREHFKSDLHRLNVKLSVAGKTIIKEEDLDKADSDSLFDDLEISSVSGSEDELENGPAAERGLSVKGKEEFRKKFYFHCHSGDMISIWRCILLKEHEEPFFDCKSGQMESTSCVQEDEMINRVKRLTCEPRDASHLRIVLLTSGGHFAGCVFDGNSIIAHKTFHRYVVRAKAGKRQSGKDATGKVAHSAGSSLRRYNEAALKKEIQELILAWKSYFDSCVCAFIYAPSKNRQMLFDGDKTQSVLQACDIHPVPLTVHRPTLKEAKRVYSSLTQLYYEMECSITDEVLPRVESVTSPEYSQGKKKEVVMGSEESIADLSISLESLNKNEAATVPSSKNVTTALHEAAKSGNVQLTLELLEQGLDPCIRDARGKTPYMLASDKEVRNTFRRFMALNLDKWDWHAADVPSALTKEMEESQAAKQSEKDAKKKARAKELKKLKKAREKEEEKEKEKAKAQALQSQADVRGTSAAQMGNRTASVPGLKPKHQSPQLILMANEEERQRKLAEEREKRAAAAERRLAALAGQSAGTSGAAAAADNPAQRTTPDDSSCSCCFSSLAGKVPFHRYNYKYCSTTCMHLHSEMLDED